MNDFVVKKACEFKFLLPVSIIFKPLPDITSYELARILPLFINGGRMLMPSDVPKEPELLRHLEVNDPNIY